MLPLHPYDLSTDIQFRNHCIKAYDVSSSTETFCGIRTKFEPLKFEVNTTPIKFYSNF